MVTASEIDIDEGATDLEMAQEIFGDGVIVVSASYSGNSQSSGIYSDGDTTSPGVVPGDSGIILSTGNAADFTNSNGQANQNTNTSTNTNGSVDNDPDFNAAAGANTYDASYLDVTFIPDSDVMTMQFVFSSEEYPEYVDSVYQDFVGVWVNGVEVSLAVGDGDVDPGNLSTSSNENLFVSNNNSEYNTEMDGFTITMTLTMDVIAGEENTIRIGIADVSDSSYDSNLLIAADSIQTDLVAITDSTTMTADGIKALDVLANDISSGGTLTITHIHGQPSDLVMTRDEGPQHVRWSGRRQVKAQGDLAPIHIRTGTFGQHNDLLVSPQHRVLVRDSLAELLFGESEVLVAAEDLVNDHSVTRQSGEQVTYVHLMFDQHQIIFSEGLETESFLLGPQTTNCLEQPIVDEICEIFPKLDPVTGQGYGTSARRTLRKFEARLLFQNTRAA